MASKTVKKKNCNFDNVIESKNKKMKKSADVDIIDNSIESKNKKMKKSRDIEEEYDYGDDSSDFEETTMEEVFKITKNVEASRPHPPDIKFRYTPVDVCFHPNENFLVVGSKTGKCLIYKYDEKSTELAGKVKAFKYDAVTKVAYSHGRDKIFVLGSSKAIVIVDAKNFKIEKKIKKAHDDPICSFCSINATTFATGDENGKIKIWNMNSPTWNMDETTPAYEFAMSEEHEVNDLISDEYGKYLVGCCTDGSITAVNVAKKKIVFESQYYNMTFTSMCLLSEDQSAINQTKLIVGTDKGKMAVFNYGDFYLDTFIKGERKESVTSLLALNDREFLIAYEDSKIRLVSIMPTFFHGIIASSLTKFSILNMSVSSDCNILASCSSDDRVKFWNIENIKSIPQPKDNSRNRKTKVNKRRTNKMFWSNRTRSLTQFMGNLGYGETFKQGKLPDFIPGAD